MTAPTETRAMDTSIHIRCEDNRDFIVSVPSATSEARRELRFAVDKPEALMRFLLARAEAQTQRDLYIGRTSSPTEDMVRQWMKAGNRIERIDREAERLAERAAVARSRYGDLFDEIEI